MSIDVLPAEGLNTCEAVAIFRLGELLKNSGTLLELLKIHKPEEIISHLSHCEIIRKPNFEQWAEIYQKYSSEQWDFALVLLQSSNFDKASSAQLAAILRERGPKEILSAIKLRDMYKKSQKKYRDSNKEKLNAHNAQHIRALRAQPKTDASETIPKS